MGWARRLGLRLGLVLGLGSWLKEQLGTALGFSNWQCLKGSLLCALDNLEQGPLAGAPMSLDHTEGLVEAACSEGGGSVCLGPLQRASLGSHITREPGEGVQPASTGPA